MVLYMELIKQPIFNVEDVCKLYANKNTAISALRSLINKHLVVKIKNGMYTCISGETGAPIASRYQIASKITDVSYVSHHTAMEYYGYCNQVYYDVFVSSKKRFKSFEFDGYFYKWIRPKCDEGVEEIPYSGGVIITDKERTVVDSINDINLISGIEEVIANINSINSLNEEKLMKYLDLYDKKVLYQKAGYILSNNKTLNLSSNFFAWCRSKIGNNKSYLTNDTDINKLNNTWNLMVPNNIKEVENGGLSND